MTVFVGTVPRAPDSVCKLGESESLDENHPLLLAKWKISEYKALLPLPRSSRYLDFGGFWVVPLIFTGCDWCGTVWVRSACRLPWALLAVSRLEPGGGYEFGEPGHRTALSTASELSERIVPPSIQATLWSVVAGLL